MRLRRLVGLQSQSQSQSQSLNPSCRSGRCSSLLEDCGRSAGDSRFVVSFPRAKSSWAEVGMVGIPLAAFRPFLVVRRRKAHGLRTICWDLRYCWSLPRKLVSVAGGRRAVG